jgi:hypothetical protein
VVASPSSSKRRGASMLACWVAITLGAFGCSTVQPQDKEYLAEPAMTWGDEGTAAAHEDHVVSNREGSFGGDTGKGGGCGCN